MQYTEFRLKSILFWDILLKRSMCFEKTAVCERRNVQNVWMCTYLMSWRSVVLREVAFCLLNVTQNQSYVRSLRTLFVTCQKCFFLVLYQMFCVCVFTWACQKQAWCSYIYNWSENVTKHSHILVLIYYFRAHALTTCFALSSGHRERHQRRHARLLAPCDHPHPRARCAPRVHVNDKRILGHCAEFVFL